MKRKQPGRKGFDLNYEQISQEYINGQNLENLANKYNISTWTLLARFKKLGIRKTTKRYLEEKAFSNFNSYSCYWAGFIAADGWISKSGYNLGVELSVIDMLQLEKLRTFLQSNAKINKRRKGCFNKFHDYCSIHFGSIKLINDLKNNFNIINNKSLVLLPPEKIPENLVRHFIRGYVDGDGCIDWHNNKPRLNICSGSLDFLKWMQQMLVKHNDINILEIKSTNKNLYTISHCNNKTLAVLDWLYENSVPETRLERKFNRYMEYKEKIQYRKNIKKQKEFEKQKLVNRVIELYNKNFCMEDITKKLNLSIRFVRAALNDIIKIKNKLSGQYGEKLINRNLEILQKYQSGISAKQLSVEFNLSKDTIWHSINRAKTYVSN